ncbi:fimbrial protein [Hafnia paralvei]|uniref:Fimbrial-type adhesion domain-containing protein n=1 Tax=Hafnia paralvei TaxID=546367 RepID=A0A4Q9EDM9_9GAMM|nr:fimbrial protein [Hafnia paralvei]TBM21018.1 hypothetical protein EYY89_21775 [Hafnia paralvei]
MKKSYIASSLTAIALLLSVSSAFAETTPVSVAGGTINFKGKVVNAACAVDGSGDQDVSLGQVKQTDLAATGDTSAPVEFSIKLVDCDSSVMKSASFGFSGVTDSADPTALANITGPGAATYVGVILKDATGATVPLDGTFDAGSKITLQDGENSAAFTAAMIASGKATPGDVTATVNFNIQYE